MTWTETLGRDPAAHRDRGAARQRCLTLVRAVARPLVLDGPLRPQLISPSVVHSESDKNAPACLKPSCLPERIQARGAHSRRCSSTLRAMHPSPTPPAATTSIGALPLNIDSLECTEGYSQCNPNCEEPVNFAFIQRGGVPAGPPSPQLSNLSTFTPNADTLLMNPGDRITIHMFDATAPAPPGETAKALEVVVKDLTTRQTGWMQASAANGFANTSIVDCTGTPFNFEPEYSTAGPRNITPWGAGTENISTEFETGHFEPCTSLSQPGILNLAPGINDKYYNSCAGPYEHAAPGGDGGTQT